MIVIVFIRTILGAFSDPNIDVSDPISDHFYKEVWMAISGRNATIYDKVSSAHSPVSPFSVRFMVCVCVMLMRSLSPKPFFVFPGSPLIKA